MILTLSCTDRPGIVAAVATTLANAGCNILESAQFGDDETGLFFMRVRFSAGEGVDRADVAAALAPVAKRFEMDWAVHEADRQVPIIVLVSRFDHCLIDLLYRRRAGSLPADIRAIVSNHPDAERIAAAEDIPFHHIPVTADTKADAEARLREIVAGTGAELLVLARYMQVLSEELSTRFSGRIINIHHSFLPAFKGAKPYHQAHARGVKLIGATAHYVTEDLDEGPIIEQDAERVSHNHSAEDLVAIGRDIESRVLARAVTFHLERRVFLNGLKTVVFRP